MDNEKEAVLEAVRKDGYTLAKVREDFQNDKEIVLEAVRQDGNAIRFASIRLRNDKEVVVEAMKENGDALQYVSVGLRDDKEVVLEAVEESGYSVQYASDRLRNDQEVILESMKYLGDTIIYASENLRNDKGFFLEAVKLDGYALQYANDELKNDRDVVLESTKQSCFSLEEASVEIQNDRTFILEVMKSNGSVLEFAKENFQNDREIVIEAVKQRGLALKFAGKELLNDSEVVLLAFEQNHRSFSFAGDKFVEESSLLKILKKNEGHIEQTLEEFSLLDEDKSDNDKKWEKYLRSFLKEASDDHKRFFSFEETVLESELKDTTELQKRLSEVHFCDLTFYRFLGRGIYGGTYLCQINDRQGMFAVKMYNDLFMDERKKLEILSRDTLEIPYHKNVVTILSHQKDEDVDLSKLPDYENYWKPLEVPRICRHSGMLLMKYHRTSLSGYEIMKREFRPIFLRILEGSYHLHCHMIVHRDLHPGNVFLDPLRGRVWIGDFGCGLDLRKNKNGFKVHRDHEQMFSISVNTGYEEFRKGGASSYLPPEISDFDEEVDEFLDYEKSDLFSIGMIGKVVGKRVLGGDLELKDISCIDKLLRLKNERIGFEEAIHLMAVKTE